MVSTEKLKVLLKPDLYAVPLLFFILTVTFYSPFLFQGKAFLAADTLKVRYPWKYYQKEDIKPKNNIITDPVYSFYPKDYIQSKAVKEGKLNLWNPYILGGYPNFASNAPAGWLYPVKILLHRFFEPWRAHGFGLFIHTFLMGVGFYLYSKTIGMTPLGAAIAGIAWMFNGYILVWLEFEHIVFLSALFPFMLYFSERFISERNGSFVIISGFFIGLTFLAGNLQQSLFIIILLGYTFLFRSFLVLRKDTEKSKIFNLWAGFLIILLLGVGIAAIQLLPSTELLFNSQRTSYKGFYDLLNNTATMPIENLISLLFPYFFLNQAEDLFWIRRLYSQAYSNQNELWIYGGVMPFLLALLAVTKGKDYLNNRKNYFLIIAVTSILFAMGTYLYYPLYLIPLFKTLNPTRTLHLFAFAISGLAGVGADYLYTLSKEKERLPLSFKFLISTISLFITLFYIFRKTVVQWYLKNFWTDSGFVDESATNQLLSHYTFSNIDFLLPLLFLISSITLIVLVVKGRLKPLYWSIIILLLVVDLIPFGWRYNTIVPSKEIYPETEAIRFLKKQEGIFRVALYPTLIHNSFMPFMLQNVGGYDSMYPRRYGEFINLVEHGSRNTKYLSFGNYGSWVALTNFNSTLLDLLNVKYILLPPDKKLKNERFRLVYDKDLIIYENMQVLPRAFMVDQYSVMSDEDTLKLIATVGDIFRDVVVLEKSPPLKGKTFSKGNVVITEYEPGRVVMKTTSLEGGILVFTENFYPGWKAYIDGKQEEILRANYTFMAVSVRPGDHMVEFHYDPLSFKIGGGLTFLTLSVMFLDIGFFIYKGRGKNKKLGRKREIDKIGQKVIS